MIKPLSTIILLLFLFPTFTFGFAQPLPENPGEQLPAVTPTPKTPPPVITPTPAIKVEVPVDNEVCFSPQEPCGQKLVALLNTAKYSIDMAIYNMTLNEIRDTLILLNKKGITIRIVVDKKEASSKSSRTRDLFRAGLNLKYGSGQGIMHNKYTIVDGVQMETGSFNYTFAATKYNSENQIYIFNPDVIKRFQADFETLWASGIPYYEQEIPPPTDPKNCNNNNNNPNPNDG